MSSLASSSSSSPSSSWSGSPALSPSWPASAASPLSLVSARMTPTPLETPQQTLFDCPHRECVRLMALFNNSSGNISLEVISQNAPAFDTGRILHYYGDIIALIPEAARDTSLLLELKALDRRFWKGASKPGHTVAEALNAVVTAFQRISTILSGTTSEFRRRGLSFLVDSKLSSSPNYFLYLRMAEVMAQGKQKLDEEDYQNLQIVLNKNGISSMNKGHELLNDLGNISGDCRRIVIRLNAQAEKVDSILRSHELPEISQGANLIPDYMHITLSDITAIDNSLKELTDLKESRWAVIHNKILINIPVEVAKSVLKIALKLKAALPVTDGDDHCQIKAVENFIALMEKSAKDPRLPALLDIMDESDGIDLAFCKLPMMYAALEAIGHGL